MAGGGGGGLGHGGGGGGQPVTTPGQRALVAIAVGYMALIVVLPFLNVFVQAFSNGWAPFAETLLDPDFQQVGAGQVLGA